MSVRDIASDMIPQEIFAAIISSDTTTNGFTIDTANFDGGIMLFLLMTEYTDGDYQIVLQDSPDDSVWTNIPTNKLILPDGAITLSAIAAAGDEIKRLGAFSTERYVRMTVVSTSTTTGAEMVGFCVKKSEERPLAAVLTP